MTRSTANDIAEYRKTGYLPVTDQATSVAALVLETLPNGECAWLRPAEAAEDDEALYTITEKGRRDLRMAELFG